MLLSERIKQTQDQIKELDNRLKETREETNSNSALNAKPL